jgi:hypothetical protein
MRDPMLLPGEVSYTPPRRSSSWVRNVIIVWIVAGLGVVLWKILERHPAPDAVALTPTAPVANVRDDDTLFHMEAVNAKIEEAVQKIRRAQDQISRTLPGVDRDYLLVERQHLNAALAAMESARRALEQARQQTNLVVDSIQKESNK